MEKALKAVVPRAQQRGKEKRRPVRASERSRRGDSRMRGDVCIICSRNTSRPRGTGSVGDSVGEGAGHRVSRR